MKGSEWNESERKLEARILVKKLKSLRHTWNGRGPEM